MGWGGERDESPTAKANPQDMFSLQDFSADMKKEAWSLGLLKSCLEDERESEAEPFTGTSRNRSASIG